jgi:hypothetical protein
VANEPTAAGREARPRWGGLWPLLLPAAYTLHLAEELFGGEGFELWTERALGLPVSTTRFLVLNGIAWPIFVALTVAALRKPALAWVPAAFGTLVVVNGSLHLLGTLSTGSYSPGLATGLLLYLPIGGYSVVWGSRHLPPRAFSASVAAGVLAHVLVAAMAFV